MAIVNLTADLTRDATGTPDNGRWYVWAAEYQDGGSGIITSRRSDPIRPVAGVLTIPVEAGIAAIIEGPNSRLYPVMTPMVDSPLWAVIEAAVAYPPDTPQALLDAAVGSYVETNRAQFRTRAVPVTPSDPDTLWQWKDGTGANVGSPVPFSDIVPQAVAEAAAAAVAAGVVDSDLAGRDLDVQLSGTDVQLTLGGAPLGDPLNLNVTVPIANPSAVKTAGYNALANELVPCDASAGPFTVNLPSAPPDSTVVVIKKVDSSGNAVTVQRAGTDVFNTAGGPSSVQLVGVDQSAWLQYKSGIWYVLGNGNPLSMLDTRYYQRNGNIPEPNGNTALSLDAVALAVNYLRVVAAVAGGNVTLRTGGASTDVGFVFRSKGAAGYSFRDGNNAVILDLGTVTNPTSSVKLAPGTAAAPASITLQGTDITQGLNIVAAKVLLNGLEIATRGVNSSAHSSTLTPNADIADSWARTAIAGGFTVAAPTGTLKDMKLYAFRFKDNGSPRAITWDAFYRAIGVVLPTITSASKTLYVICRYNAADSKMDVVDVKQEA